MQNTETLQERIPTEARVLAPRYRTLANEEDWVIEVEVPGADEESVAVKLDEDVLSIHAHTRLEEPEGYRLVHSELDLGDWKRSFRVPKGTQREAIRATVRNGLLRLTLPKEAPESRTIEVQSE